MVYITETASVKNREQCYAWESKNNLEINTIYLSIGTKPELSILKYCSVFLNTEMQLNLTFVFGIYIDIVLYMATLNITLLFVLLSCNKKFTWHETVWYSISTVWKAVFFSTGKKYQ